MNRTDVIRTLEAIVFTEVQIMVDVDARYGSKVLEI